MVGSSQPIGRGTDEFAPAMRERIEAKASPTGIGMLNQSMERVSRHSGKLVQPQGIAAIGVSGGKLKIVRQRFSRHRIRLLACCAGPVGWRLSFRRIDGIRPMETALVRCAIIFLSKTL